MRFAESLERVLYGYGWSPWLRTVFFTGLGVVIWEDPRQGIQDAILLAAFVYALVRARDGWPAWRSRAGLAFLVLFAYSVLTLPLSTQPKASLREAVKVLDLFAFAFAIPMVFRRRENIESGLLYTANALTVILGLHLVRMAADLKGDLLARAHDYRPPALIHCNIEAMMAGAAALIFLYFMWRWRRSPLRLAWAFAGFAIDVAFQVVNASRGPQIAFVASLAVAGLALLPRWRWRLGVFAVLSVGGLLLLVGVNRRFRDADSMRGFASRDVVWKHTWALALDRPLLGYGYGKAVFTNTYENSDPPPSRFTYPHPHQYGLYVLFAQGWLGVALHAAAWGLLVHRLLRHLWVRLRSAADRALPALVLVLLAFIFTYALADWTAVHIHILLIWLVPAALVLTREDDAGGTLAVGRGPAAPAEPLPPGPGGRLLFVGPFNGGVGGIERATRAFADWSRTSGRTATFVFQHADLPRSAFTVDPSETVRVLPEAEWNPRLAHADYGAVYVIPAGLKAARWVPRLRDVRAPRVVMDLDPERKFLRVTDIYHCETTPEQPPPRPFIVALPDPRSTLPDIPLGDLPPGGFYLTAFTPYSDIKGHREIPRFLSAAGRRLIWCYDPASFVARRAKYGRDIRRRLAEAAAPGLELVEAPSRETLYRLYRACAGYVCFSESEGLGWSLLDAVALGRPLASRRVGVCRMLRDFRPTDDFASPVFASYELPAAGGYETLFREVAARGAAGRGR